MLQAEMTTISLTTASGAKDQGEAAAERANPTYIDKYRGMQILGRHHWLLKGGVVQVGSCLGWHRG